MDLSQLPRDLLLHVLALLDTDTLYSLLPSLLRKRLSIHLLAKRKAYFTQLYISGVRVLIGDETLDILRFSCGTEWMRRSHVAPYTRWQAFSGYGNVAEQWRVCHYKRVPGPERYSLNVVDSTVYTSNFATHNIF